MKWPDVRFLPVSYWWNVVGGEQRIAYIPHMWDSVVHRLDK